MEPNATPSVKRPRAPSSPSSALSISPGSGDPPLKASRIIYFPDADSDIANSSVPNGSTANGQKNATNSISSPPLLCTLPPTCNHKPAAIANTAELERHYAKYHAHVCEEQSCGCVFPEARLLSLHQTECHDPLAQIRKERGDKIFQCHIPAPACGRNFLTPKARRLHLIQAHSYPKEYFFAVTNKGIGGLLKKWGEGASMVRKEWKPREPAQAGDVQMDSHRGENGDVMDEDDDGEDDDGDNSSEDRPLEAEEEEGLDLQATPRMLPRTTDIHSPPSSISSKSTERPHQLKQTRGRHAAAASNDVDGLVNSLGSLSLVPDSIRFGRGGKTGGFAPNSNGLRARGRGGRGRGRGRGDILIAGGRGDFVAPGTSALEQRSSAERDYSMLNETGIPPRGKGRGRAVPRARGRGTVVVRGRGL